MTIFMFSFLLLNDDVSWVYSHGFRVDSRRTSSVDVVNLSEPWPERIKRRTSESSGSEPTRSDRVK